MKKLLTALALSGLMATQAGAIQITTNNQGNPTGGVLINGVPADGSEITPVEASWYTDYDFVKGKVTYWTKIQGNYDITLGPAAITATQGGTLNVYTTNTDWSSPYGIGLTSNYDPYKIWDRDPGDKQTGHMSVYIGNPDRHNYGGIEYHVNVFNYPCTHDSAAGSSVKEENLIGGTYDGDLAYEAKDGTVHELTMPTTGFVDPIPAYGSGTKMTFGFTLGGATDEEGNITGLRFMAPQSIVTPDVTEDGLATSDTIDDGIDGVNGEAVELSTTAWIESEGNYVDLPNLGYGFDLVNLRSWGASTVDNQGSFALDPEAITYIWITKDIPNIPEPTTATLSLLALAGLAARRRRR